MSYKVNLEGGKKAPEWLYELANYLADDLVALDVETSMERARWHFNDGSEVEGPYELFTEAHRDLVGSV